MATQGPNSAGAGADDASAGSIVWVLPGNILSQNGVNTTSTANPTTHYLKATNFGFTIPEGATINGVVAEVYSASAHDGVDNTIKLVKGDAVTGNNKSTAQGAISGYRSFGGAADLWGVALTSADVNDATFGVVAQYSNGGKGSPVCAIDHIRMTVYYTASAGVPASGAPLLFF